MGRQRTGRDAGMLWVLLGFTLAAWPGAVSCAATGERPLVAHWTFDEPAQGGWISPSAGEAELRVRAEPDPARVAGVHGRALELAGSHQLQVRLDCLPRALEQITFSAWTRPVELSGYREIFRQECAERLLFSYQLGGTILSLGLNIGGYVECDAQIDPGQVLDGAWHHCAATFDGRWMRVYLDGRQVASLERPGTIAVNPGVPGFIGSSSGRGEFFQGGLDDLRIYADALSAEQIASLYRSGVASLARRLEELAEAVDRFYVRGEDFAQTVAACRRVVVEKQTPLDSEMAGALAARLQADFPEDYRHFVEWTGAGLKEYLTCPDNRFHLRVVGRLMELLLEYKPLTESQWAKQTPASRKRWKEAEGIAARFEALRAAGNESRFSPEWVRIVLEAGPRIIFRPQRAEAVAPYVKPHTPPTRRLSAEEAEATLRRDWLHQADGQPTAQRICQEIVWAGQLASRIETRWGSRVDFSRHLARLAELDARARALSSPDPELYFAVRRIKRQIMFANPAVDFDRVLMVDMPFPQGSEWRHQTRHRLGYMAVPGGKLVLLEGLAPGGKLTQLMPRPPLHGSFWRFDISYDARSVVFCFKPHNEKSFHLYEMNLDGTGLRQLTDGPYDDLDPIYLPDGHHLLFSTTRGHTYVRCMPPTNAFVLARCRRDGGNIYLVSYNNEPDYLPSVMDDGRVIYTRWEYTDKPLWRAQALWTMNPDGTQVAVFWGNQSVWPDLLKDARSIPGSRRVMFTGSAHHDWFAGSVGIIDPDGGYDFPHGLTKVTADVAWPESGNGPVDPIESSRYHPSGRYEAYYSPYPLGEEDFLVSASRDGKFVLYLMDVDGNRELIYEGSNHIFHALPVKPRRRPPVIEDRVAWPDRSQRLEPQEGVFFSGNVYYGAPDQLRGRARFLRILHIEPKTYTYWYKRPYLSTGPVVSAVQSEGVKRILGTVPIEPDGSVAFRAPAGMALHFQLLDGQYRALQTMRSFTGLMPGERRGCLGCHPLHSRSPEYAGQAIALSTPQAITPPPWGDESISYGRFVQPVLDRYCGKCHQGEGEAREVVDLTDRPGFLIFSEPYLLLTGRPTWGRPYQMPNDPPPGWGIADMIMVEGYDQRDPEAYRTPEPMTRLSYASRLIQLASSGEHYEVRVDPISLRRLIAWVDTMCPYRGAEEVRQLPDPEFQGVDWLAVRPRIRTAPTIVRPGPVD